MPVTPALLVLLAPLAQSPSAPAERMTATLDEPELAVAEGPLRAALEALELDAGPTGTPEGLGSDPWPAEWSERGWSDPEPWKAWADALVRADDVARGQLALLAHRQGRWDDAWRHLAATRDPALARAVLPRLMPGVPPAAGAADGLRAPLPDGALLRPALPPPSSEAAAMGRERGAVELAGLQVGDAVLHLRVALEGDGVQVDVRHAAGGPCRLAIVIPEPQGFEIRVEYVDWDRRSTVGEPHELEIRPGDEAHKLWGRFLRFPRPWPALVPEDLPAQAAHAGLLLVDTPEPSAPAVLSGFAGALERALGVPAEVAADRGSGPPGGPADGSLAPLRLFFTAPDERMEKLAAMQSLVERHRFDDL